MATKAEPAEPMPEPSVTAKASKELAAAKTGHEPFKPIRYAYTFLGGAMTDGLNGMARYGRKGLLVGGGLGLIAAIPLASLVWPLAMGAGVGFLLGAVGGATIGLVTGGFKAVGRVHRGELYAEDLIQRKKVQDAAPPNRSDYRAAYNAQQQRNAFITQQVLERNNENTRDFNTYWQDLVSGGSHADRGRGA